MNAVNMDTGYVNYLSEAEKRDVLRWTGEALGKDVPFVAGAYIENQTGDIVALYRQQMDAIVQAGGIPILFQTARMHGLSSKEKAAVYQAPARDIRRCWLLSWAQCSRRMEKSLMKTRSVA